jgi:hypothetical protein
MQLSADLDKIYSTKGRDFLFAIRNFFHISCL